MYQDSSTFVNTAQGNVAALQATVGNVNPLQWAEYQQARQEAIDTNADHLSFLAAHGLANVNPSELFASAS